MAPRKRKAEGVEEAAVKRVAETTLTRVTRSVTRRVNSNLADSSVELAKAELPTKNKKAKATGQKKKKKKEDVKAEEEIEAEKVKVQEDVVEPETEEAEEEVEPDKEEAAGDAFDGDESKERTVVIEHCKQCNSFKTRANHVKDGLEKGVPGIKVLLNPEKPRKGCFEIREEGGKKFISLLDMKRPFKPMKDLDMDEVVSDIVAKLK
ncbi:hypothetical protein AB3S75_018633 [Citrus x aurantiifolia]